MYEDFLERLNQFKKSNYELILNERKKYISDLYIQFCLEYEGLAVYAINKKYDSIDVHIEANSFLCCEDGGRSLNILVGLANKTKIYFKDENICFDLWYRCWEHVPKAIDNLKKTS